MGFRVSGLGFRVGYHRYQVRGDRASHSEERGKGGGM